MFCSKCGKEIADESIVCNYCGEVLGQATTGVATKQTGMYSKEDFLSISEDYAKEKKETERKYKNKITKCCVTMGVCAVLMFVFMCMLFIEPILALLSLVFMGAMIGSVIMWQVNINKRKAELEDLADSHYRRYINKFNNK
ncbi:MAG: zinc-ribbon domain-containing protein [Ruminococcus sp.]|nr:zinc-ribbon domain-containing protein [Ruminococcus sp.]